MVVYLQYLKRVNKLICLFVNLLQCYERLSVVPCTVDTPVVFHTLNLFIETAVAGRSFLHCKLSYRPLTNLGKPDELGGNCLFADMSILFFRVPALRPGYSHALQELLFRRRVFWFWLVWVGFCLSACCRMCIPVSLSFFLEVSPKLIQKSDILYVWFRAS